MKFQHIFPATLLGVLSSGSTSAIILSFDPATDITIPISNDGIYLDFTDSSDASAYTTSTVFTNQKV